MGLIHFIFNFFVKPVYHRNVELTLHLSHATISTSSLLKVKLIVVIFAMENINKLMIYQRSLHSDYFSVDCGDH